MESAEQRGREFLEFIGAHRDKLRNNLAKNVTYEPDLFEDVFSDTVLKVYESILQGRKVKDFEQYFYMASRNNYIKRRERDGNKRRRHTGLYAAAEMPDAPEVSLIEDIQEIRSLALMHFGERETGIYFGYMERKARGRISYRNYAMEIGIPAYHVKLICTKINKFFRN